MKDFNYTKKATLYEIFDHYYNHVQGLDYKDRSDSVEILIEVLKNKFFNHISKYTNEFVIDKIQSKGVSFKRTTTFNFFKGYMNNINHSSSDKRVIQTSSSYALKSLSQPEVKINVVTQAQNLNLNNEKEDKSKTKRLIEDQSFVHSYEKKERRVNDDSYISIKEEKVTVEGVKKEKNYFGYNNNKGGMQQSLYKRIGDLHKLELNFFKLNDKANEGIDVNLLSEVYFKLKKQQYNFNINIVQINKIINIQLRLIEVIRLIRRKIFMILILIQD
jgi:hypothetical protein